MKRDMLSANEASTRMRLGRIDIARGLALVAMAIYHSGWDFEFFGYMDPGTTAHGGWRLFARCIASSFLVLVGFSLFLAHGRAIRWQAFGKRMLQICAAAAAISAVTYYISPSDFIFFGILHQIALASLLGLAFLRLPTPLTLIVAVIVVIAPLYARSVFFDHPALAWVGLSSIDPRSNDYVPLFPWFGAVLFGIALARLCEQLNLMHWLSGGIRPLWLQQGLTFIGRHSLAFYLIHQPVLIGLVFILSHIVPPTVTNVAFVNACQQNCQQDADANTCQRFCGCVVDQLEARKIASAVYSGRVDDKINAAIQESAQMCSATIVPDAPLNEDN